MITLQILKREIQAHVVPGLISIFQLRKRIPRSKRLTHFKESWSFPFWWSYITGSDTESEFSGQLEARAVKHSKILRSLGNPLARRSPWHSPDVHLEHQDCVYFSCVWWFFFGSIIHSSSVAPFSSCSQSFTASGSFPMSRLSASGGQRTGASALASVLPMGTLQSLAGSIPWGCKESDKTEQLSMCCI